MLPIAVFFSFPTCGCSNGEAQHNQSASETTYAEHQVEAPHHTAQPTQSQDHAADNPESSGPTHPPASDTASGKTEKQQTPGTGDATRPGTDICGTITDEMIHQGEILFSGKGNCSTCHKGDATGSPIGPNLTDNEWIQISGDYPSIITNIKEGVPLPVEYPTPMPAMGGAKLNDQEVCALAAYVWSLNK